MKGIWREIFDGRDDGRSVGADKSAMYRMY